MVKRMYLVEMGNNGKICFDGYDKQEILLIDNYDGWIEYRRMLKLLNNWKVMLKVKGRKITYSNWKHVYIACIDAPNRWYKQGLTDALKCRIDNVWCMKERGILYNENDEWGVYGNASEIVTKWRDIDEI